MIAILYTLIDRRRYLTTSATLARLSAAAAPAAGDQGVPGMPHFFHGLGQEGAAKAQPGSRPLHTRLQRDYPLIDLDPILTWEIVEIA